MIISFKWQGKDATKYTDRSTRVLIYFDAKLSIDKCEWVIGVNLALITSEFYFARCIFGGPKDCFYQVRKLFILFWKLKSKNETWMVEMELK